MIIGFIGSQRSGKTAMAVLLSYLYHLKGHTILTNMESINFPHRQITGEHFKSLEKMKEIIKKDETFSILIDEAHLNLDSRTAKKNTAKTWLITQAGKLMEEKGHFFYTTQYPNQIDKRLRYNTAYFMLMEKLINKGRLIFKAYYIKPLGDATTGHYKVNYFDGDKIINMMKNLKLYNRFEMIKIEE